MKVLIILVIAAIVACSADPVEDYLKQLKNIHDECLKSSQCDKETIKKYFIGGENVDTPQLRNYLLCASKKKGFRNEAGAYQQEAHKNVLLKMMKDEAKVDAIIKKCANEKSTPEESIIETAKCFEKELYIFLSTQYKTKLAEAQTECKKETGVSEEAAKDLLEGKETTDVKAKGYSLCVMKKLHGINEAGELNEHVIKTTLYLHLKDEDKVKEIIEKCFKNQATPEETAYQYALCRFKIAKH